MRGGASNGRGGGSGVSNLWTAVDNQKGERMTKPGRVNSLNELCGREVIVQTSSRASWRGDMFGVVDGVLTLHIGDQGVCLPLANVESVYDANAASPGFLAVRES